LRDAELERDGELEPDEARAGERGLDCRLLEDPPRDPEPLARELRLRDDAAAPDDLRVLEAGLVLRALDERLVA
jgi:hypothetical protein